MNVDDIISRIRRDEDSVTQFKRQAVGVATIASFASKELPYRGLGTGVRRAVEVVPDIQFESDRDANWLKAIVRRTMQSDSTVDIQNREMAQKWPKSGPETVQKLSASTRQIYEALREEPRMTYRGLKEGLIRRIGPKKGGRWEVLSQ